MITKFFDFQRSLKNETLYNFQYCTSPERNFRCFLHKTLFKSFTQKLLKILRSRLKLFWKYLFLKISQKLVGQHLCRSLFLNKIAGDSTAGFFSWKFCAILKSTYFVTYQRLPLYPQTYNTRSWKTTTIAKNLETCHKYKLIRRII